MTKSMPILLSLALSLLAPGCGDKKDGDSASGKAAESKAEPLALDGLGVKVDVPKGASQSELLGDIMVQAPGTVFTVGLAKADDPDTIEKERESAEMFGPKNVTEEKLADGYVFRFENTGSMGTNYWVTVRREIGGKAYNCSSMQGEKKMADAAVAACKSLRQ